MHGHLNVKILVAMLLLNTKRTNERGLIVNPAVQSFGLHANVQACFVQSLEVTQ